MKHILWVFVWRGGLKILLFPVAFLGGVCHNVGKRIVSLGQVPPGLCREKQTE